MISFVCSLACAFQASATEIIGRAHGAAPSSGWHASGAQSGGASHERGMVGLKASRGASQAAEGPKPLAGVAGITISRGVVAGKQAKIAVVKLKKPLSDAQKQQILEAGYRVYNEPSFMFFCQTDAHDARTRGMDCFRTSVADAHPGPKLTHQ
ncbi:MAG TPA: hypothetical protein VIY54_09810 [Steroidobacteraceae bacterium]